MEHAVKFIGEIHSVLRRMEDCPLQESENAPEAEIIVFPEYLEGIKTWLADRKYYYLPGCIWLTEQSLNAIRGETRRRRSWAYFQRGRLQGLILWECTTGKCFK